MSDSVPFTGDPADTHEAIMHGTFFALKEYGYAELSIQRISNELNLSKSTLYHHFSGKEDLLLSFFDFLLDYLEQFYESGSINEPQKAISDIIDALLNENITPKKRSAKGEVLAMYVELRSQAIRDAKYRERIAKADQRFIRQIAAIINTGIDQGVFQAVEPEETAEFLLAVLHGILIQGTTRESVPYQQLHQNLTEYLQAELFVE